MRVKHTEKKNKTSLHNKDRRTTETADQRRFSILVFYGQTIFQMNLTHTKMKIINK